jgi:hypothetical protein
MTTAPGRRVSTLERIQARNPKIARSKQSAIRAEVHRVICKSPIRVLANIVSAQAFQSTGAHYSYVRACTRFAHTASQAIDVECESYRSIIGATHKRCDKFFIRLMLSTLSRSNRYLERLTILSRGRNCSPESTEMWRSIGWAPIAFAAVATAHAARTSRISRAHLLPRPKISSGLCRPVAACGALESDACGFR